MREWMTLAQTRSPGAGYSARRSSAVTGTPVPCCAASAAVCGGCGVRPHRFRYSRLQVRPPDVLPSPHSGCRMLSRRTALWALAVIFAANFLNYTDRQLVSALEKPITTDPYLELDSEAFGWLWSYFTIGYMICAMPIGLLADRYRRPRIFAVCIAIWSVATVASGLAQTRWVLNVARIFIGVGE